MLKFRKNEFKILLLGDVQVHGLPEPHEREVLTRCVKESNPDLIIFLGDMLSGVGGYKRGKLEKMLKSIIDSTAGEKIPFAVISGNHDHYSKTAFKKQLLFYHSYPNCLTPIIEERACEKAYTLDLADKTGKPVFRFLLLDCAGTKLIKLGLDYKVTSPSVRAYTEEILNDPACPPAIVFQHITVPDVMRLFDVRSEKFPSAVRGRLKYRGKYLKLKNEKAGHLGECPCPSWNNTNQFSDWVKSKKVKAAVFAHDHKNCFVDTLDRIKIIQTPCAGLSCYGDDAVRGARVLTLTSAGKITSTPLFHQKLANNYKKR